MVAARDVTFQETVFYDRKEPDLASQLRVRADQILDVIEVIHPPSSSNTDDIDTDSDDGEDSQESSPEQTTDGSAPVDDHVTPQSTEETQPAKPPTLPTPEDTPEPVHRAPREIIGNVDPINVVQGS